ncbi:MAG: hypothetical protein RLZZ198_2018 [Bacteroidota bacterium]|jgi:cytoplasmic iron level regulating protein YaaA (DUF328/UPF0246 family)
MRFKILISPAKNLRKNVFNDHDRLSVPQFLAEAKLVHRSLAKCTHGELVELMSISAKLASESKQMIKLWDHNFLYRAVEMFDGEVYRGLAIDTLADEFNDVLSDRLRILSGLYGILNPNDLVAPYRLEMKTKLPVKKAENLYQFWGEKIAKHLKKDTDVLVNLASDEYSKVVLPFWDKDKVITPVFMEENEGNPKVVMMYAKNARGKMARFIIEHRIENLSDLQGFDLDGYRFDKERSVENRLVFLR